MAIADFLASMMLFLAFSLLSLSVWPTVAGFVGFLVFWLLHGLYIHFIMPIPFPTADEFEALGFDMIGCKRKGSWKSRSRRFKAHFGAEPDVIVNTWVLLHKTGWLFYAGVRGPKPVHLLWALLFLRRYGTEETMATITGVREDFSQVGLVLR